MDNNKIELLLEAEKRGILPQDKAELLNEARSRGLIDGASTPEKNYTPTQKHMASMVQGVPFGADIAAGLGSAVYGRDSGVPYADRFSAAKDIFEAGAEQGMRDQPVLSTIGMLSTALPAGFAIPYSAYQAPSVAARIGKGVGIGAGIGAMYGAGTGQGQERLENAFEQGVFGGVFGGTAAGASDAIRLAWRGGSSLAKKAASLFNRIGQPEPNITIRTGKIPQGLTPTVTPEPIQMTQDIVPLTRGQAEQSARLQSLEYGAQHGAFGDEAQRLALEARDIQNEAAKGVISKIGGGQVGIDTGLESATSLKKALNQSYKAAKAKTSLAYGKVSDLAAGDQLKIAGEFVNDTVVSNIDDFAKTGFNGRGFDLNSPKMSNAKRLYDQVNKFKKLEGIKSVDFFRMEDWRSRVSQGIAEAEKGSPEKAFLSGLLDRYDTAMRQLPKEAILNGDDAIIDAMEKARMSRRTQGVLFEKSKIIKDIVTNEDMTNEQFYNVISSMGDKSGRYVRDILRTASDDVAKQDALRTQIKQSVVGGILNKSLLAEVKAGGTVEGGIEKMISFDKLATNLEKLMNNKTLFNQVFPDQAERETVQKLYNASSLIKSVKPGAKNYSNTAYTLFNFLRSSSPSLASANVFGVGLGTALKSAGQAGATNELSQSLAPVLKQVADEATGPVTNFGQKYGRQVMGAGFVSQGTKDRVKKD